MIRHQLTINKHSKGDLQELYDLIKKGEEDVEIYICDKKRRRSAAQRRYYYAVIVALVSQATGMGLAETNEELKLTFNPKERVNTKGETVVYGGSLENEPPARVEQIYTDIRAQFDLMDIHIPEPERVRNKMYVDIMELHKQYNSL